MQSTAESMVDYYFLGTLLPDLKIDEQPEIDFSEFERLLKENLTSADFAKTVTLRNLYDINNLRSYWKGEPLDPIGNLNESDLEEALVTRIILPPYVFAFMDKYETQEERLRHFPELLATFFRESISKADGFFKYYLTLEREMRLILVAFRAKALGRDLYAELQYEDPDEELIAQILAQKDAPSYIPPEKYSDLKHYFEMYENRPIELQKALLEYRFNKIDEKLGLQLFSIDRILAYMAELIMVEHWQQMDKQKGIEIIESMLKEPS